MNLPIIFQRLEGTVIFLGSLYIYHMRFDNWLAFFGLFLVIDLSMAGYLLNKKVGAYTYNIGHTFVLPALVYMAARYFDNSTLTFISLVWFAHIALDRALGIGLKFTDDFKHTHLGAIGKK